MASCYQEITAAQEYLNTKSIADAASFMKYHIKRCATQGLSASMTIALRTAQVAAGKQGWLALAYIPDQNIYIQDYWCAAELESFVGFTRKLLCKPVIRLVPYMDGTRNTRIVGASLGLAQRSPTLSSAPLSLYVLIPKVVGWLATVPLKK
ncbi:hypothetical protein ACU8KH_05379 [Lachancea thermotolerans]